MLDKEELKSIYNKKYVLNLEKIGKKRIARLTKLIYFSENDRVVDFACGSAFLYEFIYDKVRHYYGVDFSEPFIDQAKKKVIRYNLENASLFCEEITDFCKRYRNFFDKAFAFDFTEHIYDKDFNEIFLAIRQSLKKDGELFIHTPNGDYFLEIFKKMGILKQIKEHIAVRNTTAYQRLLEGAGFRNIHVKYIAHYNIMKYLHPLSYLPFVGKYFKARLFITCRN